MGAGLLVLWLGCSTGGTVDSGGAALGATLHVLSPSDGAELVEGEAVWLEVAGESAEGAPLEPEGVIWSLHGTDWTAQGNRLSVTDLQAGWALLLATAEIDGIEVYDGVEIVVGDGATGDTGEKSTDTDTGTHTGGGPGGIDHVLSLVYDPSPDMESQGYTDCSASYSSALSVRTAGDLCPDADMTVEGSLSQDSTTCPPELTASIPDPIAYGIDSTQPDGWGIWVPDSGAWYSIGTAVESGGFYRLITEQSVAIDGTAAGEVTWRFDFTP